MSRKTLNLSRILFLLALTVATIWIIRRHNQPTPWQDNRGEIFGTYYRVQYAAKEDLGKAFLAELQAVDNSLSMFNQLSNPWVMNTLYPEDQNRQGTRFT